MQKIINLRTILLLLFLTCILFGNSSFAQNKNNNSIKSVIIENSKSNIVLNQKNTDKKITLQNNQKPKKKWHQRVVRGCFYGSIFGALGLALGSSFGSKGTSNRFEDIGENLDNFSKACCLGSTGAIIGFILGYKK